MANEVPVTVRTRKFLRNPLLARRQMVRGRVIPLVVTTTTRERVAAH